MLPGTTQAIPALLLDLSRSGLFVKGSSKVELGAEVVVRFRLRPNTWCEGTGTIVRRTQVVRLHGFGVHFERTNAEFAEFIAKLEAVSDADRSAYLADVLAPVIEVTSA